MPAAQDELTRARLDAASAPSRADRWTLVALLLLPFVYLYVLAMPRPFALGLNIANDFKAHRIWYAQDDAYFLSKGYVPLWNPAFEMGTPYLGMVFGTSFLYPLRWWVVFLTQFGGPLNYAVQYVQIAAHMSLALGGLYAVLRRFGGQSSAAAALGSSLFLLNQCFNNFIRFPHGIEDMAWTTPMLYFALALVQRRRGDESWDRRSVARDCAALAFCVAMGWLTGYGQFTYVGGLFVGLVAVAVARTVWGVCLVALAGAIGTLAAVGMIWPTAEWVLAHPLRNGHDITNINVQGVTDYADMLLRPFGVDVHFNVFTFPHLVLLAVIGLLSVRQWRHVRLTLAMLVALIVVLDVARGLRGLSFHFLYDHLPGFGSFNSPSKIAWMGFIPLAWLAGIGIDAARATRTRLVVTVVLCVVLSGALAMYASPAVAGAGEGIWKPVVVGWIHARQSIRDYGWLVLGSSAAVCAYLLVRSGVVRALLLCGMCGLFVAAFARHNTFVEPRFDAQAVMSSRDAFPDGLLGPRRAEAYLGLSGIGVTSPTVDPAIYALMMGSDARVLGGSGARFPGTRFVWIPRDATKVVRVRLVSFGPNHVHFDADADGAGRLIYLARYSPRWTSNRPYSKSEAFHECYEFAIERGISLIRMTFLPIGNIAAAVFTILASFGLAAAYLVLSNRRRLAVVAIAASSIFAGAFVAGSLNRRGMSERELFGVHGTSQDAAGVVSAARAP